MGRFLKTIFPKRKSKERTNRGFPINFNHFSVRNAELSNTEKYVQIRHSGREHDRVLFSCANAFFNTRFNIRVTKYVTIPARCLVYTRINSWVLYR